MNEQILENTKIARVQNQYIIDVVNGLRERIIEISEQIQSMQTAAIIAASILVVLSIIIIVNQVKLKKQLRQLQEMLKEKEVTSSGDQTATDETNQKS